MIIPEYWAEGRAQHREAGRQITMRRFGWSDISQADAQAQADRRAADALARARSGEALARREPKIPYNGAEGVPIREEIVSRHGDAVITRNAYGARCLNTPDVLFIDIDYSDEPFPRVMLTVFAVLAAATLALGGFFHSWSLAVVLACAVLLGGLTVAKLLHWGLLRLQGGAETRAMRRISQFSAQHPDWNLRLYRTPAGLRAVATHRPFDPHDPAVAECFQALGADPLYMRMCLNQRCFRARVSAKPWRIGIQHHMRPRPGVWPVAFAQMAARSAWIRNYESVARDYAACIFVDSVGSGIVHPKLQSVLALHDELSGALSGRVIA